MRNLFISQVGNKRSEIYGDGGAYYLHLLEDGVEKEVIEFREHTLKIVENKAREWTDNESKAD